MSQDPNAQLWTLGLGSCVAVLLFHHDQRRIGMVHVALPDSKIHPEKAKDLPGYFADTGFSELMHCMQENIHGTGRVTAKLVGGANVMDTRNSFAIGKRNLLAVRKLLFRHRIPILAEQTGGMESRSVKAWVKDGSVWVKRSGEGYSEL